MMLWCEIHAAGGIKGGVTNFDLAEYEPEIAWLTAISQVGAGCYCLVSSNGGSSTVLVLRCSSSVPGSSKGQECAAFIDLLLHCVADEAARWAQQQDKAVHHHYQQQQQQQQQQDKAVQCQAQQQQEEEQDRCVV
jgi:hypothetical protein